MSVLTQRKGNILYWMLVVTGVASFVLAVLLPEHIDTRFVVAAALVYYIGMELLLPHLIKKRESIPSLAQLSFRHSKFDWFLSLAVVVVLTGLLFTDYQLQPLPIAVIMLNVATPSLGRILLINANVPHYILTGEKIIVNDFSIQERKLSHLDSIRITGLFQHIRISFYEGYDIKIRKSHYTEAELAAFIQAVLDAAPVEVDVDHEVRAMLTAATITNRG